MDLEHATASDLPLEFGHYTLLSILGEGGMARVFEAELHRSEGFRKRVALKIIKQDVAEQDELLRESLFNEARLGALLHHTNLVDTYDFGELDGRPFIAMELVRGTSLDRLLKATGALPPGVVIDVGVQLCAGLHRVHTLEDTDTADHLVHRDLKPSNVFIARDGTVKIGDFGIAKANRGQADLTGTGLTRGTPAYMSPEQLMARKLDPRSDLFALGAILFELATGERFMPRSFRVEQVLANLLRVDEYTAEIDALGRVDAAVAGLGPLVGGLLRGDREQRTASAREVRSALRRLAREHPESELEVLVGDEDAAPPASIATTALPTPAAKPVPPTEGLAASTEVLPEAGPSQARSAEQGTELLPSGGDPHILPGDTDTGVLHSGQGRRVPPSERPQPGRSVEEEPPSAPARRWKWAVAATAVVGLIGLAWFASRPGDPVEYSDATVANFARAVAEGLEPFQYRIVGCGEDWEPSRLCEFDPRQEPSADLGFLRLEVLQDYRDHYPHPPVVSVVLLEEGRPRQILRRLETEGDELVYAATEADGSWQEVWLDVDEFLAEVWIEPGDERGLRIDDPVVRRTQSLRVSGPDFLD
jgi:eukaryotic-like serine/threonine-protein kinase